VICIDLLGAVDRGGSIIIHTFGAYYGLTAAAFLTPKESQKNPWRKGNVFSQTVAILGTLFLFMYWPSFNAVFAKGVA